MGEPVLDLVDAILNLLSDRKDQQVVSSNFPFWEFA